MIIRYENSDKAWSGISDFIEGIMHRHGAKSILEIGAGANPLFSLDFAKRHNLSYTILDISLEELAKAPSGYRTIHADIGAKDFYIEERFEFVFSRMLAEHVKDGSVFHRNVKALLTPRGVAFHFFPTLYATPFIVNYLLPEKAARTFLKFIQSGREDHGKQKKFPAYYSWCRGPTKKQISRFSNYGLEVKEYIGFFGHCGYYKRIPLLKKIHSRISNYLVRHPVPCLTSYAYVVLKNAS